MISLEFIWSSLSVRFTLIKNQNLDEIKNLTFYWNFIIINDENNLSWLLECFVEFPFSAPFCLPISLHNFPTSFRHVKRSFLRPVIFKHLFILFTTRINIEQLFYFLNLNMSEQMFLLTTKLTSDLFPRCKVIPICFESKLIEVFFLFTA